MKLKNNDPPPSLLQPTIARALCLIVSIQLHGKPTHTVSMSWLMVRVLMAQQTSLTGTSNSTPIKLPRSSLNQTKGYTML
jgi:hypothetical protein